MGAFQWPRGIDPFTSEPSRPSGKRLRKSSPIFASAAQTALLGSWEAWSAVRTVFSRDRRTIRARVHLQSVCRCARGDERSLHLCIGARALAHRGNPGVDVGERRRSNLGLGLECLDFDRQSLTGAMQSRLDGVAGGVEDDGDLFERELFPIAQLDCQLEVVGEAAQCSKEQPLLGAMVREPRCAPRIGEVVARLACGRFAGAQVHEELVARDGEQVCAEPESVPNSGTRCDTTFEGRLNEVVDEFGRRPRAEEPGNGREVASKEFTPCSRASASPLVQKVSVFDAHPCELSFTFRASANRVGEAGARDSNGR